MKILHVVNLNSGNQYIDLLYNGLKSINEDISFSVDAFFSDQYFDIIHFHWPEALNDWLFLTEEKGKQIEKAFLDKKKAGTKFVYTLHNLCSHQGVSPATIKLYAFLEKEADGIIHLGEFSYPIKSNAKQTVIPHHTYQYKNEISHSDARKALGLSHEKFVVLVFGKIRSFEEQKTILTFFKGLKIKDKFLLVPRWYDASRPVVKSFFNLIYFYLLKYFQPNRNKNHLFQKGIIPDDAIQTYFNAADVVFIPRNKSINSGILPLAFSFGKPVIGFNHGNTGEIIKETGNFILEDLTKHSLTKLSEEISSNRNRNVGEKNKLFAKDYWDPIDKSNQHIEFYRLLMLS